MHELTPKLAEEWHILDTGTASAKENMRIDCELLQETASREKPVLHLYEWKGNCATYGHFLDPYQLLHQDVAERHRLELAKRPTGGGLVFHLTDFAYSILIPAGHPGYSINTLKNYAFINRMIVRVVKKFTKGNIRPTLHPKGKSSLENHFCMAKPTQYDVMVEGRKVGGAAQRRTKPGFLHQGTIAIALPPEDILISVLKSDSFRREMKQNTYALLPQCVPPQGITEARQHLRTLLIEECIGSSNCYP
ncbi:MAG: hypothetical protein WB791_03270 [Waddliaceae bacterium]